METDKKRIFVLDLSSRRNLKEIKYARRNLRRKFVSVCREMIRKAVGNLHWIDILPCTALNVYTILKCTHLVMTQQALDTLTTRLRTPIFRGPIDRAKWNGTLVVQPIPLAA